MEALLPTKSDLCTRIYLQKYAFRFSINITTSIGISDYTDIFLRNNYVNILSLWIKVF